MADIPPSPELLRALGRLARGLSALFWGLPVALIICVQTAKSSAFELAAPAALGLPLAATALLYYGLVQIGHFQPQERIWVHSLDRAKFLALINLGLTPFLYWYHALPEVPFYAAMVNLLMLSALLFLFNLNEVLNRLSAMLPDESLRVETRLFTTMNRCTLVAIPAALAALTLLARLSSLPRFLIAALAVIEPVSHWVVLFLFLLPLAMTMTLVWKIKETVLASVFGAGH